jgi:kynurenine formamidase
VSVSLSGARVFDLEQPRWDGAPMHPGHVPPGFSYLLHRRHHPVSGDRRTSSAGTLISSDHAGTHIDALCHQAFDMKMCGGRDPEAAATSFGYRELGVETIEPIVARGWLVDLGATGPDRWIELAELQRAAAAQGVRPAAGDVVLVRTGNGVHWHDPGRYLRGAGMAADVSRWLAGLGVRAVGADNMAWDRVDGGHDPDLGATLPGHVILLVQSGVHILENLFLEELAASGVREFTFVCLPLKIRGATGSPVRPVAIVQP